MTNTKVVVDKKDPNKPEKEYEHLINIKIKKDDIRLPLLLEMINSWKCMTKRSKTQKVIENLLLMHNMSKSPNLKYLFGTFETMYDNLLPYYQDNMSEMYDVINSIYTEAFKVDFNKIHEEITRIQEECKSLDNTKRNSASSSVKEVPEKSKEEVITIVSPVTSIHTPEETITEVVNKVEDEEEYELPAAQVSYEDDDDDDLFDDFGVPDDVNVNV